MPPNTLAELNLLVEAEGGHDGPRLSMNGRIWRLKAFPISRDHSGEPVDYTCVSYVWGRDRVPNPLGFGPRDISNNTLPSLSAAMHNTDTKAFWIDAFCIPTAQPARAASLESMGYIYSRAKEVRAALSESSFLAIRQLDTSDRLDAGAFATLEADRWVQSVWTYQEVVNSQRLAFVCPGAPGSVVDGRTFLNGVGFSISKYKKEYDVSTIAFRRTFPSLDALEDLAADWMTAGYRERSALAVMANMDRRKWNEDRNYFYSMIGAVTSEVSRRSSEAGREHLAETFMKICEAKGDFSFIYSSNPRSTDPSRRWRPQLGLLPSILPWHCWGESQPGHFDESGSLWLDQIIVFKNSAMSKTRVAKDRNPRWPDADEASQEDIAECIRSDLITMGFTGSKEFVSFESGMFFPQTSLPNSVSANINVLVSGTIRWTLGAPGIASYEEEDRAMCFVPGVFVETVDDELATSSARLG